MALNREDKKILKTILMLAYCVEGYKMSEIDRAEQTKKSLGLDHFTIYSDEYKIIKTNLQDAGLKKIYNSLIGKLLNARLIEIKSDYIVLLPEEFKYIVKFYLNAVDEVNKLNSVSYEEMGKQCLSTIEKFCKNRIVKDRLDDVKIKVTNFTVMVESDKAHAFCYYNIIPSEDALKTMVEYKIGNESYNTGIMIALNVEEHVSAVESYFTKFFDYCGTAILDVKYMVENLKKLCEEQLKNLFTNASEKFDLSCEEKSFKIKNKITQDFFTIEIDGKKKTFNVYSNIPEYKNKGTIKDTDAFFEWRDGEIYYFIEDSLKRIPKPEVKINAKGTLDDLFIKPNNKDPKTVANALKLLVGYKFRVNYHDYEWGTKTYELSFDTNTFTYDEVSNRKGEFFKAYYSDIAKGNDEWEEFCEYGGFWILKDWDKEYDRKGSKGKTIEMNISC